MSEHTQIYCLIYGGFGVAFLCLLLATIGRGLRVFRWLCFIGAFFGLIYEGGCMMILGGIGKATGGSDVGADKMMDPVKLGFFIAFVWWFVLVFLIPANGDECKRGADGANENLSERIGNEDKVDKS